MLPRRIRLAALPLVLLTDCAGSAVPEPRVRLDALLAGPTVPVVFEPRPAFAVVSAGDALTFSPGFERGAELRDRFQLASPAAGFADAFVAALREAPRFSATAFMRASLADAGALLAERAAEPIFYASVVEWRLVQALSLQRHRLVLGLQLSVVPAAEVAAGRGAMALPERVWRGACTVRGPDPPLPLSLWLARDGSILRAQLAEAERRCVRTVAERLVDFLAGGKPQSAFDFGDLPPEPFEGADGPD